MCNYRKQAVLLKQGESDIDAVLKETAQDFYDASVEELNKFKAASRTTGIKNTYIFIVVIEYIFCSFNSIL